MSTLEEAIAFIKAGNKQAGQEMLADLIQADLDNELAWLWLSSVVDTDDRRRQCLVRVLEINPDNKAAQRGLAKLGPPKGAVQAARSSEPAGPLMSRLTQTGSSVHLKSSLDELKESQQRRNEEPATDSAEPEVESVNASEVEPDGPEVMDEIAVPVADESTPVPEDKARDDAFLKDDRPIKKPSLPRPSPATALADGGDEDDSAEPTQLERLQAYAQTEKGLLVIAGSSAAALLVCVACGILGIVALPVINPPPTATAIVSNLPTPVPTATPTYTPPPTFTATPVPQLTPSATSTSVVADTPTVTPTPSRSPTPDRNRQTGFVVQVVSGDVIDVVIDGAQYQVKYILVDTPDAPEPFSQEALDFNRQWVENQEVTLERDALDQDSQGRLLRYVYAGSLLVNEELIRQGVGRVSLEPPNTKYAAQFQVVEADTRALGIGIWSVN